MSHTPGPWEFGRSDLEDAAAYIALAELLKGTEEDDKKSDKE